MSSVQMYYGVKCKRTAMELYEFYFKQLYNYVVRSKNGWSSLFLLLHIRKVPLKISIFYDQCCIKKCIPVMTNILIETVFQDFETQRYIQIEIKEVRYGSIRNQCQG